jgi:hypothetical protein
MRSDSSLDNSGEGGFIVFMVNAHNIVGKGADKKDALGSYGG